MDEKPDPDAGKTRAEMIAEIRRMQVAIAKAQTESARNRRRLHALEAELATLDGKRAE